MRGKLKCWLKPIGIPRSEVNLSERFDQDLIRVDFATIKTIPDVKDVIFGYRIDDGRLLYKAVCVSLPTKVTGKEIAIDRWRKGWPVYVMAENLNPDYGRSWMEYEVYPWKLYRDYKNLNPDDTTKLGSVQYGAGAVRISEGFASCITKAMEGLD